MAFMTNDGWTSISIFTGVSFMKGSKERMTEGLVYIYAIRLQPCWQNLVIQKHTKTTLANVINLLNV